MTTWWMMSHWSCTCTFWMWYQLNRTRTVEILLFMLIFSLTALILRSWLGQNTALCIHVCLSLLPLADHDPEIEVTPNQELCPNTVILTWSRSTHFQECISGYTVNKTTARETQSTSVTSNTTSVSVDCCLWSNFTVTPVYNRSLTVQMATTNIPLSLEFISGQISKTISIYYI